MKLNLGCGQMPLNDHVNMDRDPQPGTNVCGDLTALPFISECADEIKLFHCIEHVTLKQARAVLRDVHRIVKEGGKVVVEAPDILKAFSAYENPYELSWHIFGDQGEIDKGKLGYIHLWGWTGKMCAEEMKAVGFKNIKWSVGKSHGRPERDFRVEGTK